MIRRRQAVIPRIATASVTEQVQVLRGNRKFCLHHESAMWAASSAFFPTHGNACFAPSWNGPLTTKYERPSTHRLASFADPAPAWIG
ncbi:hypothetical protein SNOG_02136 [Parastagonospora nodorum SN15]|uniref:Uncharacterized protein n=1 Tax=Phaeosphaeria nodorum (strain SN15 / ATCC MYA-4574 / FGSC 10173) TaxID=321614 RepID=Q0V1H8_PHANO|nr:hypothetical protein SNOG_02136 [Parastagonospora nodorum SN15]EAT90348.1 hypothetical protein SNOG_02136 [Parastagonospora nodorum SN15]